MKKIAYFIFALFLVNVAFAQTVEFQVNMAIQAKKGNFNPASDSVKLAGNFNGWNTTATYLTDDNNDSVYTVTIDTFAVGDTLYFKFIKGADGWEADPNREYVVPTGSSVYTAYFDRDTVYVPSVPKPITITFVCNMEFEKVSGRFNPVTDTLTVRGDFNGWSGETYMEPSDLDPNMYTTTFEDTLGVAANVNYKFAYTGNGITSWESGDNRILTITQEDYDAGVATASRTFGDLDINSVTNNPVTIKFVVDVNGAVSSITGQPFTDVQNVVLAGANAPLAWPGAGWPDTDSNAVIFMFDDGTHGDATAGDKIYTYELTFPQYSPFSVEYKYGANWGLPSINTGGNDNENSIGSNHKIMLTTQLLSATVDNKFGVMGDHELIDVVTGITEVNSNIPDAYALGQNYPNPFNPSTNINFSIKNPGLVSLKVYNTLGQEVATLLNEEKAAGTYTFSFDASKLSSGIYFYSITTGNFTATKKMILIK